MRRHDCADCGVNTWDLGEMYHVLTEVWTWAVGARWIEDDEVVGPGSVMLCIGCLETRLGRKLTPEDFSDAPINWCPLSNAPPHSERLRDRLWIPA